MQIKNYDILVTREKRSIAYVKRYFSEPKSKFGIMFLGGFKSDMSGTKASYLEKWCSKNRYNFLKFDYSGHGYSSEAFETGCISDWSLDASAVLDDVAEGPQILVGSSMGGWISLILGKMKPKRIAGFVGIAAAPDFTEDSMWSNLDKKSREELARRGKLELENDYSTEPYIITEKLITDGRSNLILTSKLEAPFPVRLLQGMKDNDVHFSTAIKLSEHIQHEDVEVKLLKNADHQFSSPYCLKLLKSTIKKLL